MARPSDEKGRAMATIITPGGRVPGGSSMSEITRALWVRLLMYALWLTLAAAAVAIVDPETSTAGIGALLLAITAAVGIVRPFRGSHLIVAGVAAIAYASIQALRSMAPDVDPDAPYLPAAAVGAVALALSAIVAEQIRGVLRGYDEELAARQNTIDELETIDPITGCVKRVHGERIITSEVERARRYQRNLTILLVGPDDWLEINHARGAETAQALLVEAAKAYVDNVRTVDRVINMTVPDFAVLLPETNLEGAQIVAEKLADSGTELFGTQVRVGIAAFPEDQVTGAGLMHEAQEALSFARTAQIPVASRSLLS